MSQQRPNPRQETVNHTKKMKRSSVEETLEGQAKQKSLMNYFSPVRETQRQENLNVRDRVGEHARNKAGELGEQLKQKESEIEELKKRKAVEADKINKIAFETKQFKIKSRSIIAQSVLELAEIKRIDRHKKDERLGYFTENMRAFQDGQIVLNLKRAIKAKENQLQSLQQQKFSKTISEEEKIRTIGSYDFIFRELTELRSQLQHREKEVTIYKDRMRWAEKETRSLYFKQGWPIVFDRYQTLELLGAGGFGEVYKCYDLESNRLVALKIVSSKEAGLTEAQKQAFLRKMQRQADIQKQLNHPNIAAFHSLVDINRSEGRIAFELEYCNGIELSVYLRKQQCLEEKQARLIIKQLFSAVKYLSQLQERVIHYDLKPSNIMLCDGIVKILDFGLCKVMKNSEQSRMELTSQGVGTYWYLPPETFQSYDPMISCKVDVWSLGVIFFELLFGKKPFAAGIPQTQIYEKNLITKSASKPIFPKEYPKKYAISESALSFITLCLKYNSAQRPTPEQAYKHPYLNKE